MGAFVGFGFGAIQAGLFLHEAHRAGAFSRLVAAEVDQRVVDAVRAAGDCFTVNIAHPDGLEQAVTGPVALYNPLVPGDRAALVEALAQAREAATALPSIAFYSGDSPAAVARILGEALMRRKESAPLLVYTAENNNHAAEHLREAVAAAAGPSALEGAQLLNTVIGKMSGVLPTGGGARAQALAPVAPGLDRAFLVEAFNHILISQIAPGADGRPVPRGISVFEEKKHLLAFEEAKLFGHNAIHAMGGYLAAMGGLETMAELRQRPGIVAQMRRAFIEESGAALVRRYQGLDALFTPEGMHAYAQDLLERMLNPWLEDAVPRVTRDPLRKLGWDDRLIGAMRLCIAHGIVPRALALGAAAAVAGVVPGALSAPETARAWLQGHWGAAAPADEAALVAEEVAQALPRLAQWQRDAFA